MPFLKFASAIPLKSLGLSIVVALIIFSSQALATVPTDELNQTTDGYFGFVRPEMRGKKIQPSQTLYQKEWLAIREVMQNRLVWMELPVCYADPGTYGYEVENYGETVEALTNAVFYARHTELVGRLIRPGETALIEEWKAIKRKFPPSLC